MNAQPSLALVAAVVVALVLLARWGATPRPQHGHARHRARAPHGSAADHRPGAGPEPTVPVPASASVPGTVRAVPEPGRGEGQRPTAAPASGAPEAPRAAEGRPSLHRDR